MDTRTRHSLKQDSLATAAASSAHWMSDHRSGLARWVIAGVVAVVLVIGAIVFWNVRSAAADTALGSALDTYSAQLTQPGSPGRTGEYSTVGDRTKRANEQFAAVAAKYSWLPQGGKAHYFVGVTDVEMGQQSAGEGEFKIVAESRNRDLANLGKLALANLYHQSSRDAAAIDELNQVIAKPSATVPATLAELNLADLYMATGKRDQARAIWAKIKDADKEGAAGSMAAQKLAGAK